MRIGLLDIENVDLVIDDILGEIVLIIVLRTILFLANLLTKRTSVELLGSLPLFADSAIVVVEWCLLSLAGEVVALLIKYSLVAQLR